VTTRQLVAIALDPRLCRHIKLIGWDEERKRGHAGAQDLFVKYHMSAWAPPVGVNKFTAAAVDEHAQAGCAPAMAHTNSFLLRNLTAAAGRSWQTTNPLTKS